MLKSYIFSLEQVATFVMTEGENTVCQEPLGDPCSGIAEFKENDVTWAAAKKAAHNRIR